MQALVLSDDPATQLRLSAVLIKRGFQVAQCESVLMATAHVRACVFDLVAMEERVHGQLTHGVALSAEKRAPFVKTVLLSNRTDAGVEELYELLPSLVSIISPDLPPDLIGQFAFACVAGRAQVGPEAEATPNGLPEFNSRRAVADRALAS
ncbi:hypothetical protein [Litoreibacter janthinus]|uniref:Response regulatory domain-containing protein n=1 Tax=Litoreibacter janthinus TaxID=670154 RepID=A0A1I6GZQ5_9RHOB|nr:hypothetical protein [Litoreibacter janthinus]SFR47686.1 hypothetical protein SAMN04488002_2219 [Litoreibacter janthinus]